MNSVIRPSFMDGAFVEELAPAVVSLVADSFGAAATVAACILRLSSFMRIFLRCTFLATP